MFTFDEPNPRLGRYLSGRVAQRGLLCRLPVASTELRPARARPNSSSGTEAEATARVSRWRECSSYEPRLAAKEIGAFTNNRCPMPAISATPAAISNAVRNDAVACTMYPVTTGAGHGGTDIPAEILYRTKRSGIIFRRCDRGHRPRGRRYRHRSQIGIRKYSRPPRHSSNYRPPTTVDTTTPNKTQTTGILQLLIVERPRLERMLQIRPPVRLTDNDSHVNGMAASHPVLAMLRCHWISRYSGARQNRAKTSRICQRSRIAFPMSS